MQAYNQNAPCNPIVSYTPGIKIKIKNKFQGVVGSIYNFIAFVWRFFFIIVNGGFALYENKNILIAL